jgi:hypothetical protein
VRQLLVVSVCGRRAGRRGAAAADPADDAAERLRLVIAESRAAAVNVVMFVGAGAAQDRRKEGVAS